MDAAKDQLLQGGRASRAALKLPGTFSSACVGADGASNRNLHVHLSLLP